MSSFIVGLTGGIGSGKSAAADCFAEHGIAIVDADIASRAVVEPGQPALDQIASHFGGQILQANGTLDRTALRAEIFANDASRHWLQSLLHPLINRYLREHLAAAPSPYAMLVNPLLIETKQQAWCDRVLVIDVPVAVQIERTMARDDNSQAQVEAIVRAQADRETRLAAAHDVIENVGDLDALARLVVAQHGRYLQHVADRSESP